MPICDDFSSMLDLVNDYIVTKISVTSLRIHLGVSDRWRCLHSEVGTTI